MSPYLNKPLRTLVQAKRDADARLWTAIVATADYIKVYPAWLPAPSKGTIQWYK